MPGNESGPEAILRKKFSGGVNFASVGPIAVRVDGLNGENLGVGRLIGIVHRQNRGNAHVISIGHPEDLEGETELLNTECSYLALTPAMVDEMIQAPSSDPLVRPSQYLIGLLDNGADLAS